MSYRAEFAFTDLDFCERSTRYKPGGLCPVRLGEILGEPPRYRIIAKLGYGGYSTVWLARDMVARYACRCIKNVTLKIIEAADTLESRESEILRRLQSPSSVASTDQPLVLQIYDAFKLHSANGAHQVLVTETVILLQCLQLPYSRTSGRDLVRQAIEAVAFIHDRGVAHGGRFPLYAHIYAPSLDLHPRNLGVAVPDLDTFSDVDIWHHCGQPEIIPLIAYDPARDLASFPPYLSMAIDLGPVLREAPGFSERRPRVRVIDLGNAYVPAESPSPRCYTRLEYTAPEVLFPSVAHNNRDSHWDCRADIWALACTIHQLMSGNPFCSRLGGGVRILRETAALCGGAPKEWQEYFASRPGAPLVVDYSIEIADNKWKEREESFRAQGEEDAAGLVKLLRRMLVIDPTRRPSASELLQDSYFAPEENLPRT
ncbi:kinase-like domain-containing protein [Mycena pura]|uniref:Kinase-like domain-containing protein n=1 Tax=Mycena pura TaxID=153505 RepID=A0AAD6V1E0_9AGAR|nr:kinase-like domain-containing protein [Mycena pura]